MPPDADLTARMDASLAAYWGSYGLAEGSLSRQLPGAHFVYTPIPLYLFNSVVLTGQDPVAIDATLGAAAACIAEKRVPVLWRLSPSAVSKAVRARLEAAGLKRHGREPAMLASMTALPPVPPVDGLRIASVEGRPGRHDWASLTCDAFELAPAVRSAMSRCEAAIPEAAYAHQACFTGYLDGRPVAVSALVMAGGLAGIYAVATLPEARRRGVGTAMTLHAMAEGRRRGASMAVLQATDFGRPVYERIGFSVAFDYDLYLQS